MTLLRAVLKLSFSVVQGYLFICRYFSRRHIMSCLVKFHRQNQFTAQLVETLLPPPFLQASITLLGVSISPVSIGTTESAFVKKGSIHEPDLKFRAFRGNAQAAISASPARSVSHPVIKWWASWTLSQSRSDVGTNRIGYTFKRLLAIAVPIKCSSRWFDL